VADARPAVAINDSGDWIANYSRSAFVGNGIGIVKKMVTYPRSTTPGAVAIKRQGRLDLASTACLASSAIRPHLVEKDGHLCGGPGGAGDVAINDRGDWIACYSKSTFVGSKTASASKMVSYDSVALAASSVAINASGDWIACNSKSTFVGYRTSSSSKMVTYDRRTTPGAVAINDRGDWIACYSKSTFVGFKRSSSSKMVTYKRCRSGTARGRDQCLGRTGSPATAGPPSWATAPRAAARW